MTTSVNAASASVTSVNAGGRLDRLPVSSFHYRIFWLIGAGMFFDGYDLYVAGGVLAATIHTKFSTLPQNLQFLSLTFVGMTIGSLVTGFVGDKYGRRFTYQINLLIFGLASLAAAFAQDMPQLIICRFVQGLGLGAEIVVGYSTLTEFVPPASRGRWLSFMAFLTVCGFPVTAILSYLIIPTWGWRPMFVIAGLGSLVVWYLRKNLPESPRWLEAEGRTAEAEALLEAIEKDVASTAGALPAPAIAAPVPQLSAADMFKPPILQRLLLGCWVLITINTLIFGFVIFLPQFFLRQGLTITNSLGYTVVLAS
ncbi:MAG: MFS transporter, partial [Xanthobacteraceae bacterium]